MAHHSPRSALKPSYGHRSGTVTGGFLRRLLPGLLMPGLLLPNPCLGCGCGLGATPGSPAAFGLCTACRGRLRRHVPGCPRCGEPLPGRRRRARPCARCRRRAPAFAALLSPWLFEPPLVEVIHAFKFGRCPHLGAALALPLTAALREARPLLFPCGPAGGTAPGVTVGGALVAPVPLHPWRRLRRGYDQAAELARPLAHHLGLPYATPLRRRRATPTQARLPRQRRLENVAGAFAVRRGHRSRLPGCTVFLVDDVATTGATLAAAARALRDAGAARVVAIAAARTPPPHDRPPGCAGRW